MHKHSSNSHPGKAGKSQTGSAMADFAPALFLLLLVVFFPMLDLAGLALSYGCVWYLNHLQVREAAVTMRVKNASVTNQTEVDQAMGSVLSRWSTSGLGQFSKAHAVSQQASLVSATTSGSVADTSVTTTASVEPFLPVPFFIPLAGLNRPVTFSVSGTRPVEDDADEGT